MAKKPSAKGSKKTKERKIPKDTTRSMFEKAVAPKAKLVLFSVTAIIPTQQYGNIQPRIEVTADSIEEARAVVMPIIENLYQTYAEMPLSGKLPKFYGAITEKVTHVEVGRVTPTEPQTPTAPQAEDVPPQTTTASTNVEKPEAVLKAEKAISLAMTSEAATLIKGQIEKSVKIPADFKPNLILLVDGKIVELEKKA